MERVLSSEEKIRRAEEIYARRKRGETRRNIATVNVQEKKDFSLFKKMIIQMLICLVLYSIFHLINSTNYIFSEDVISQTRSILEYDVDIENVFNTIGNYFNQFINNQNQEDETQGNIDNEENNNEQETEIVQQEEQNVSEDQNQEEQIQEEVPLSQMEQDAKYVKENFQIMSPLTGIISSEFGDREVTNDLITPVHYGIDIAADTGAGICAAMDGEVIVATTSASYGNFIEIQNQDVITVYAHCNDLLVSQGSKVGQGDVIATVGSTGDATRSTSTF